MRRSRPPVNGEILIGARLRKGMTQEQVQEECARRGRPVFNLSRMESGDTKRPHPATLLVLAEVLDLDVGDLLAADMGSASEDGDEEDRAA